MELGRGKYDATDRGYLTLIVSLMIYVILSQSQNMLLNLAKETGDVELLELKDELSISLQMCDQFTYDNAFVYFQPGV